MVKLIKYSATLSGLFVSELSLSLMIRKVYHVYLMLDNWLSCHFLQFSWVWYSIFCRLLFLVLDMMFFYPFFNRICPTSITGAILKSLSGSDYVCSLPVYLTSVGVISHRVDVCLLLIPWISLIPIDVYLLCGVFLGQLPFWMIIHRSNSESQVYFVNVSRCVTSILSNKTAVITWSQTTYC